MAAPGDFILVSLVEDEHPGRRFVQRRNDWPYHVTLLPWFAVDDRLALENALREVAAGIQSFTATVGKQQAFGAHEEIPVNIIDESQGFHRLHATLLSALTDIGATGYDTRWIGEAYQPHVTRHYDGREGFEPGFCFEVSGFYMVRLEDDNTCQIVSYYKFGVKV